ncbi:efflux transporter outer membrane subunit [Massilia sp. S19_KUP03_FR1]|uniref:efflux transporter outer membrane subunit n=1 Tax=Massilia sp. S19_KUP03_FR1 TaxID=3025503 RepID=UPI002FCDD32B
MKPACTALTLAVALALGACAGHAPKTVTAPAAPAAWRHAAGSAALQEDWWQGFGDATLAGLINEALARNQDLRQAAARVAEARALAAAQHAAFWPSLDAGIGAERARSISDVTLKPYLATGHQELFQAAYEVDLWGRIGALAGAADLGEQASRAARDSVALSVAASVAQAYIGLLELDAQLDLARRLLVSRDRTLVLARQRREQGYASSLELIQAEAERDAGAQALPQLTRALARQEAQLNLLPGRAPGPLERGGALAALRLCALPDAGLPSALLRRRPDIYSAELQVAASDAQLAAARAQWLPSLRLNASVGRVGSTILRGDPFTIWSLGGSVLAPLFNGGRIQALARASQARRDQALAAYERTVLGAWAEVEVQLDSHAQQQLQLRAALAQRQALAEALRIAGRRLREGYGSALDERLAERNLLGAEQGVVSLQSGLLQAQVALYRALGGGWSGMSP